MENAATKSPERASRSLSPSALRAVLLRSVTLSSNGMSVPREAASARVDAGVDSDGRGEDDGDDDVDDADDAADDDGEGGEGGSGEDGDEDDSDDVDEDDDEDEDDSDDEDDGGRCEGKDSDKKEEGTPEMLESSPAKTLTGRPGTNLLARTGKNSPSAVALHATIKISSLSLTDDPIVGP